MRYRKGRVNQSILEIYNADLSMVKQHIAAVVVAVHANLWLREHRRDTAVLARVSALAYLALGHCQFFEQLAWHPLCKEVEFHS